MARLFNPNDKISASLGAGIVIVILIVLNAILNIAKLPYLDISPNKIHTLSSATKAIIEKIDPEDPITIEFYYTANVVGLPREVKEAGKEVERMLKLYNEAGKGKIEVRRFYPNPMSDTEADKQMLDEAKQKGLKRFEKYWTQNTSIIYCGLVISRGSQSYVFDNIDISLAPQLEFRITSGLAHCLHSEKKKLGIISGLDFRPKEIRDREGRTQVQKWEILDRLEETFETRFISKPETELFVSKEGKEVPAYDLLLVVQPRGLSEADYQAIDQYVLQGKGVLFCESPFSFQELILLSQSLQVIESQYREAVLEEAQAMLDKAQEKLKKDLQKTPELLTMWQRIQSKNLPSPLRQQMIQQFQMKLFSDEKALNAFQEYQKSMEEANKLAQGRAEPSYDGKASKLRKKLEDQAKEILPPGRLVNEKLFQKWGINLLSKKLLFAPASEEEKANISQFTVTIGGPQGNPKCMAKDRMETQNLEVLYPSFCGLLERFGEFPNITYHPLVRVDKQFSTFVPNTKAKIKDWFALESFEKFLNQEPKDFDPENPYEEEQRHGDRWREWNKALFSKGDQLFGWYDVVVAVEGKFPTAFPNNPKLKETPEGKISRIVVMASVDILDTICYTEEDKEKQRTNHRFILDILKQLSLDSEIAALSRSGNKVNQFDVLQNLVREAEEKAKEKRLLLEIEREKKRNEAKAKYNEVLKKYPNQNATIMVFGIPLPAEYIPEEQKIEIAKAEKELDIALQQVKIDEQKQIERIEYEVANATRVKKDSVRMWGTFLPPFLILFLGLIAGVCVYHHRNS